MHFRRQVREEAFVVAFFDPLATLEEKSLSSRLARQIEEAGAGAERRDSGAAGRGQRRTTDEPRKDGGVMGMANRHGVSKLARGVSGAGYDDRDVDMDRGWLAVGGSSIGS